MKKVFAAGLILAILFISGCGAAPEQDLATTTVPAEDESLYFEMDYLPQIEAAPAGAVNGRYYEEFRDTFEPREDYGALVPFVGSVFYYTSSPYDESEEMYYDSYLLPQCRYGLMTADGRIVTDDVFLDVDFRADAGSCGAYICETFARRGAKSLHVDDADAPEDFVRLEKEMPERGVVWYISADGTWGVSVPGGRSVEFGRTCYAVYPSEIDWAASGDQGVAVYDYSGKLQYKVPNKNKANMKVQMLDGDVLMTQFWGGKKGNGYVFTDTAGKRVLSPYEKAKKCTKFGAYLIVQKAKKQFLLADSTGKEIIPECKLLRYDPLLNTDYLVAERGGKYVVLDGALQQVGKEKSFRPYPAQMDGRYVYSDKADFSSGKCWLLETDKPYKPRFDSEDVRSLDSRYAVRINDAHDSAVIDMQSGKDLVCVPYAYADRLLQDGGLLYLNGLYGQGEHMDYLYDLKARQMKVKKDIIRCYETADALYLVCYGDKRSVTINYTTGETLYQKNIE